MVYDFSKTFKTYDANSYEKDDFARTHCPKCYAVGRFKLHGSYRRHAGYFHKLEIIYVTLKIKRIRCRSCKATHAVMPGDLIPYKMLSLFVVLVILGMFYLEKKPVLKIAEEHGLSYQLIYSILYVLHLYAPALRQYFREVLRGVVPPNIGDADIVGLIKKPYLIFQSGYIELNKRPCFMCKFFGSANAPPIGRKAPILPPGGQ